MALAEASVAVALLDVDVFGPNPAPVVAAPTVLRHSMVLSAEQIERLRSLPHLELLRSAFRGS